MAGLQAARGRKGGRKPAISDADVKKAAAMLLEPNITKKKWLNTLLLVARY